MSLRFPDISAAAITGTHGVVLNPAALFVNQDIAISGYHSFGKDDFSGDDAVLFSAAGLGFGYQRLDLNLPASVSRYDFAASTKLMRNLYAGASYVYYKTDVGAIDKAHSWNFSLLFHAARSASVSLQAQNINKQRFFGEESAIDYSLSTAIRPLGEILTVGADLYTYSGWRMDETDWRLSANLRARRAMNIFASLRNDGTFGAGLEFQFGHASAGGESFFDSDAKYTGSTIYGTLSSASRDQVIRGPRSILHVDFSGKIPEESSKPFLWGKGATTVYQKIEKIRAAAKDPKIRAMLVTVRNPEIGWARLRDFREAIADFQKAGKRVIAYLGPSVGNGGYYMASVADGVYMQPVDALYLTGLSAQVTFYKGTMDKLGIEAEMERAEEYKNYPEVLTDTTMSPPFRESIETILDDLYEQIIAEIGDSRKITTERLKNIIDIGPFTSTQAESLGLIDGRFYTHELEDKLPELYDDYFAIIPEARYESAPKYRERFGEPPAIALIAIEGSIVKGGSGFDYLDGSTAGSGTITHSIRAARKDPDVKAIVVRINSPGGDAIAADLIWAELNEARKAKPTIVSMSDVCASGGYYIAAASDHILLEPTTITGSIGVFAGKANLQGLYSKVGLHTETVRRGKHAGMFSWSQPFSKEERAIVRRHVDDMYFRFTSVVSEGRQLPLDSVRTIAKGRTWSGSRALELGLADTQGSVLDAIKLAQQRAQIKDDDFVVVEMPRRRIVPSLTSMALSSLSSLIGIGNSDQLEALKLLTDPLNGGVQTRMPYEISIE